MGNAMLEREVLEVDVQALQELTELDPSYGFAAAGCCCMNSWMCGIMSFVSGGIVTCGTCTNTND